MPSPRAMIVGLIVFLCPLLASKRATAQTEVQPPAAEHGAQATLIVTGFAPDAVIAIDGTPVGTGYWTGTVPPGPHLVQVYKPGGPAYEFQITAVAGQSAELPPRSAAPPPAAAPAPVPPSKRRLNRGLWLLGHVGIFGLTANPDGFEYELVEDSETGETRHRGGAMWWVGGTAGYRLSRGVGFGGLLMYGRGGGEGTVTQTLASSTGGTLTHTGPADFTLQFVRVGPHLRFMAGGDRARFLGSFSIGASYQMVNLVQVDVVEQGGLLLENGDVERDEAGLGPYWGFDLGAEFNPGDHLLLGVAFDFYLDRTNGISSDPYGGTAQGYIGLSARIGYHDWQAVY
jgi:hypothetical protein